MYNNLDQDSANASPEDASLPKRLTYDASPKAGTDTGQAVDSFDIDIQACSSTDCTGLIPALPRDEFERESYEELYPYMSMKASDKG